jgi:ATP-dependent Clp protease adapter protein ClpS
VGLGAFLRKHIRIVREQHAPPGTYDRGASVALHLASNMCGELTITPAAAMTPEVLLLALAQDDAVSAELTLNDAAVRELEATAFSSNEVAADFHGWGSRARGVLITAAESAGLHGGTIRRGDLLSALGGVSGLPHRLIADAGIDFDALRHDRPQVAPAAREAGPDTPSDATVWLVAVDDDATPMNFVVHLIRERFGHTQARAQHLMYVTHFYGRAKLATLSLGRARELADEVHEFARLAGHPFALQLLSPVDGASG